MKRVTTLAAALAIVLSALLGAPALAVTKTCNAQAVTYGVCRAVDNFLLCYDAPAAAFADLRDALAWKHNHQTEITCATARQWEPLLNGSPSGVLAAAGVSSGDCTAGQVGQAVANPQDPAAYADAMIQLTNRNIVIQHKQWLAEQASGDPTSIPTPDVGP